MMRAELRESAVRSGAVDESTPLREERTPPGD
jgi:hypothetical protein